MSKVYPRTKRVKDLKLPYPYHRYSIEVERASEDIYFKLINPFGLHGLYKNISVIKPFPFPALFSIKLLLLESTRLMHLCVLCSEELNYI